MDPFITALRLFGRDKKLRKLCTVPLLIGIVLFGLVSYSSFNFFVPKIAGLGLPGWLATVAYLVVWWTIAGAVFSTVLLSVAGWAFDAIARRTDELLGVTPRSAGFTAGDGFKDNLKRFAFGMSLSFVGLIAGIFLPVIGSVAVFGFLSLLDTTAPAMQRRGIGLKQSFKIGPKLPNAVAYAAPIGMLATLPVVSALLMPLLVIAGSVLVARTNPTPQDALSNATSNDLRRI